MKKLLAFGNRYARQSTWKDFALTKLCLFSMGLIVGTLVSERCKGPVIAAAAFAFAVTYTILIVKMIRVARKKDR